MSQIMNRHKWWCSFSLIQCIKLFCNMPEKMNFNNSMGKVKCHGYKHTGIRIKVIDLSSVFIIYQLYELGEHFLVFLYITHSHNENFDYYPYQFLFSYFNAYYFLKLPVILTDTRCCVYCHLSCYTL